MGMDGGDTAVSGIGSVSPGVAGSSEEVSRMMQEFERRIASLESRLDDVVDARERLERQVAAQTEELRVQRAAIARTQRAVRNLSRSEDEGPTEPAIRDPES
jgi:septal ring factor EnvC (AmiA/AmiB activator)